MKLITILIIFLIIVGFLIASTYNLDLSQSDDQKTFLQKYSGYMIKTAKNVKSFIKQDWRIEDVNSTKINE